MPLLPLPGLLAHARQHGYALGYFEAWDSYSFEGVLDAARAGDSPVIMGFGATMLDGEWLDGGGIAMLGATGRALLADCPVPVALLLNETHSLAQAVAGINAGFTAVMMDTHHWPAADTITAVADLVKVARPRGVAVEAEVGSLPDFIDGRIAGTAQLTDPAVARDFVHATGVDCLAVSVGNVHLLTEGAAVLDLDRLRAVGQAVPVPLALHGGTGLPLDALPAAIAAGVAKINVGTRLKTAYLEALSGALAARTGGESVHDLLGSHRAMDVHRAGRLAVSGVVAALLERYGSIGRSGHVLREVSP